MVSQWEVSSLWCELQRERPELLTVLDNILAHAVAVVQDSTKEKDSLEQALRRFLLAPDWLHVPGSAACPLAHTVCAEGSMCVYPCSLCI